MLHELPRADLGFPPERRRPTAAVARGRPNIAAQHLGMDSYSQAHHLAKAPMDALNRAQHRIDYVRAVAPYRDRITIQLDWNL